jgi:xanthine dehydrogenase YagS FAD-binding subunit
MRPLAPFKYYEATSVQDAVSMLNQYAGKAKIYAGGVDIVDWMKKRYMPTPSVLVNIKKIPGLNTIQKQSDGIHIGPTVTLADLINQNPIQMLADAAKMGPAPNIRTQATVGGNICQNVWCWYYRYPEFNCYRKGGPICFAAAGRNQFHAVMQQKVCNAVVPGDVSVALTALNANLTIQGTAGTRTVPINQFYIVLGNVLKTDEMITDIVVPEAPSKGVYLKSRTRGAIDFATASVALATTSKGTTVALGGVAPIIPNGTPSDMSTAISQATPLGDNKYKVSVVGNLLKRASA